jgi:hypothetical protein
MFTITWHLKKATEKPTKPQPMANFVQVNPATKKKKKTRAASASFS